MYVPKHFEETDVGVLHALVGTHPLGAWVTAAETELLVNHVPFLVDRDRGPFGTLVAHVARANPVWRSFSRDTPSVVVFQGPQGYISPSWYATKSEHGRVVPTWNYAVVHAHGAPRAIEDRDWLLALVERLTRRHESSRPVPWNVSDAPKEYVAAALEAIVGIEIPVRRLEGKWKMSQNHPAANRQGVVEGLRTQGDEASLALSKLVEAAADAGSPKPSAR